MTSVSVIMPSGKGGRDVELPGEIFESSVNIPLMHQVVVAQEAAARQGTHATKTRGMVRGGGKKPYRQKGTGRARQGSLRAPQYAGGGVVHGPVPRSYAQRTPKKMKAAALHGALSDRLSHGRIAVVSSFVDGEEPSTKGALSVLSTAIGMAESRLSRPVLVVIAVDDVLARKSLRNVEKLRVLDSGQLNTYDVLANDHVVFTQAALGEFVSRVTGAELTVTETAEKPAAKSAAKPKRASTAKAAEAKADEAKAEEAKAEEAKAEEAKAEEAKAGGAAASAAEEPTAGTTDEPVAAAADEPAEAADEAPAKPARASRARKPAAAKADEPAATDEASADEPAAEAPAKPARASRARKPKEEQE
jgi:large subunit ribosomal protein L4